MSLSLFYESFCSSIILKDENGKTVLGRNLDYFMKSVFKPLLFLGSYVKNGEEVYVAHGFAGVAGIVDGVRIGSYALSLNMMIEGRESSIENANIRKGMVSPMFMMQHLIENQLGYETAKIILVGQEVISGCYMIISSFDGQGAVITKTYVKSQIEELGKNDWFLYQGNQNRDAPKDEKRKKAESMLTTNLEKNKMDKLKCMDETLISLGKIIDNMFSITGNGMQNFYSIVMDAKGITYLSGNERKHMKHHLKQK